MQRINNTIDVKYNKRYIIKNNKFLPQTQLFCDLLLSRLVLGPATIGAVNSIINNVVLK